MEKIIPFLIFFGLIIIILFSKSIFYHLCNKHRHRWINFKIKNEIEYISISHARKCETCNKMELIFINFNDQINSFPLIFNVEINEEKWKTLINEQ